MSEDRGPDGGLFVPFTMPHPDRQQIKSLANKHFSQNVADIINLFFSTQLDSWAIEFSIGRYPVKLIPVSSRETVAETWHNPVWKFERLAKGIEKAIRQSDEVRGSLRLAHDRIPDWCALWYLWRTDEAGEGKCL